MNCVKTVILAAGFGSRLWPLSTPERPKQFQPLIDDESLLSYTYTKLSQVTPVQELYVFVRAGMEDLVRDSLPDIATDHILVTPKHRNTLPEVMWALRAVTDDPTEPVLFKSVDHFIKSEDTFATSLQWCMHQWLSREPAVTILGIPYTEFNSNDGYMIADNTGVIRQFLEKPDREVFEAALVSGQAFRNPFIFIMSQQACLSVLADSQEEWAAQARRVLQSADLAEREQAFLAMSTMDMRGVWMTPSEHLQVLPLDYGFIDVGRFEELYQLNHKDTNGNVVRGNVILGTLCQNSLIINQMDEPLVVMSANGAVIVQTPEGSLATPFEDAAKIGDIFKQHIHPH